MNQAGVFQLSSHGKTLLHYPALTSMDGCGAAAWLDAPWLDGEADLVATWRAANRAVNSFKGAAGSAEIDAAFCAWSDKASTGWDGSFNCASLSLVAFSNRASMVGFSWLQEDWPASTLGWLRLEFLMTLTFTFFTSRSWDANFVGGSSVLSLSDRLPICPEGPASVRSTKIPVGGLSWWPTSIKSLDGSAIFPSFSAADWREVPSLAGDWEPVESFLLPVLGCGGLLAKVPPVGLDCRSWFHMLVKSLSAMGIMGWKQHTDVLGWATFL